MNAAVQNEALAATGRYEVISYYTEHPFKRWLVQQPDGTPYTARGSSEPLWMNDLDAAALLADILNKKHGL